MDNNIIEVTEHVDIEKRQEAVELHQNIMISAEMAATAFVKFCEGLKKMRDTKLYEELGFASFEDYTSTAVGLKQRQAYNYISVYENVDPSVLENSVNIGITKLGLLVQVPETEQIDFAADNDLAGMTVEEIKEAVKKYHDQSEQLSLLEEKVEELESGQGEIPAEQLEAIEREARSAADKEYKAKIKEVKSKATDAARTEMKNQLAEAAEKAKQEALDDTAEALKTMEAAMTAAQEREKDLKKRLDVASNQTTLKFSFHFENLQTTINKMLEIIESGETAEEKSKLRGAVVKYMDGVRSRFEV